MANKEFEQFQKQLGKRIQELRIKKGFSQESLAAAVEMDRVSIGYDEQGKRAPKLITLFKIARALGVNVKDLLP